MPKDWIIIFRCNNSALAEMIKTLLEDSEIDVVMMNKMDSMHLHLNNAEIALYVKPSDVILAKHIISKTQN